MTPKRHPLVAAIVVAAAPYLLSPPAVALAVLALPVLATADAATQPLGNAAPCDAFRRNADGGWTASRAVTVSIGSAQVSVAANTTYRGHAINVNGVDFAAFLDDHCGGQNNAD